MRRFRQLGQRTLSDPDAEAMRREHHEAITALQDEVRAGVGSTFQSITLTNGTLTPIAHGLGRVPSFVGVSVPRGAVAAGYINEVRNSAYDRKRVVVLQANNFGATITVDVEVK